MANDLNQCNFIGRLGADPETRYSTAGEPICNFRIAVGWKGKDKEGAEWVPIVTYGKLAEICGQYLKKGSQVFISGRFRTRPWDDKDGNKRYTTEITADTMQMLGGKGQGSGSDSQDKPQRNAQGAPRQTFEDLGDGDIPF